MNLFGRQKKNDPIGENIQFSVAYLSEQNRKLEQFLLDKVQQLAARVSAQEAHRATLFEAEDETASFVEPAAGTDLVEDGMFVSPDEATSGAEEETDAWAPVEEIWRDEGVTEAADTPVKTGSTIIEETEPETETTLVEEVHFEAETSEMLETNKDDEQPGESWMGFMGVDDSSPGEAEVEAEPATEVSQKTPQAMDTPGEESKEQGGLSDEVDRELAQPTEETDAGPPVEPVAGADLVEDEMPEMLVPVPVPNPDDEFGEVEEVEFLLEDEPQYIRPKIPASGEDEPGEVEEVEFSLDLEGVDFKPATEKPAADDVEFDDVEFMDDEEEEEVVWEAPLNEGEVDKWS